MKNKMWFVFVTLFVIQVFPAVAQEQAPSDSIPLRVQVVLSRHDGEKKLSSLPYTMWVNAMRSDRQGPTSLRMGVQVPIPSAGEKGTTFTYRNVGTNIDCAAQILGDGRYRLSFTIEQSSIFPDDPKKPFAQATAGAVMLRSFTTNFVVALKDGQSAQNTTATDPVNGEVLKVDVTMNVIK